nr:antibiotic biosynthesis monooxygenase [Streptomyces boncukensis]
MAADDGTTLLHFSQVEDLDAVPGQDLTWKDEVDAAVPGIERVGVVAGRRRRSTPAYGASGQPSCVVLVTRVFDGPDRRRAEQLIEAMFESTSDTPPADGLLSAHFYVSPDGARVLNYALWASWQQAHAWPGLLGTTFQRFRPVLHLNRPGL